MLGQRSAGLRGEVGIHEDELWADGFGGELSRLHDVSSGGRVAPKLDGVR
jgi:hypothetical protein